MRHHARLLVVAVALSICSGCVSTLRVTGTQTRIPSLSPGGDLYVAFGGGKRLDDTLAFVGTASIGYAELPGSEGSALVDVFGLDVISVRRRFAYRAGVRAGARIGLMSTDEVMKYTDAGRDTPDGHGVLGARFAFFPWATGAGRGVLQLGIEVGMDAALGQDGGGARTTPMFTIGLVFEANVYDAFGASR